MAHVLLSARSVQQALEAWRQARPLPPQHPLAQLLTLRYGVGIGGLSADIAPEIVITFGLAEIIRHGLNRHRKAHQLIPAAAHHDRLVGLQALCDDFRCANAELEAWSLLYYRYVRVDLNLSLAQMSQISCQTRRTLHRRLRLGISRLSYVLIKRELQLRRRQRKAALRVQLPAIGRSALIGREVPIEEGCAALIRSDQARHVLIYGAPGVGKTAVALHIAHRMIAQTPLHGVVWIPSPQPSLAWLKQELAIRLGSKVDELPVYLQGEDTLVILDQAQSIVEDASVLAELRQLLNAARLLLIADRRSHVLDLSCIQISDLSQPDAFTLLERLHPPQWRVDDVAYLSQCFQDLGGNPKALHMAVEAGRYYDAVTIAGAVYRSTWQATTVPARRLWLALEQEHAWPESSVVTLTEFPRWWLPSLCELEDAGILQVASGALVLTPLARSFARTILVHGVASGEIAQSVTTSEHFKREGLC
jgi:hypothetical protein